MMQAHEDLTSRQTTASRQAGYGAIDLTPRGRHFFVGMSGTGKSTALEKLALERWVLNRPKPRILLLDSKPRFRAETHLNGLPAKHLYKKWRRGPTIPDSYVLNLNNPRAELKQVWDLGGNVAIAQTTNVGALRAAANAFYLDADDRYDQLLVVDETADYYGTTGYGSVDDPILKVVRSGRERNITGAFAGQRPKGLPHSFLTELSILYLFNLASVHDLKHLEDMGLPGHAVPPEQDHVFLYFNRYTKHMGKYRLGDVK